VESIEAKESDHVEFKGVSDPAVPGFGVRGTGTSRAPQPFLQIAQIAQIAQIERQARRSCQTYF
jgi:hypothetical protein